MSNFDRDKRPLVDLIDDPYIRERVARVCQQRDDAINAASVLSSSLRTPTPSPTLDEAAIVERCAPDVSSFRGAEKLAHLMAWYHFGLAWDRAEKVSQAEMLAACQLAVDFMNQPAAIRRECPTTVVPTWDQVATPNAAADALAALSQVACNARFDWLGRDTCLAVKHALATYRQQQPGERPLNDEGKA